MEPGVAPKAFVLVLLAVLSQLHEEEFYLARKPNSARPVIRCLAAESWRLPN